MTEIWVPYGPVEVSFDIRQENLSQIIEPQPPKLEKDALQNRAIESAGFDSILILSQTKASEQVLDSLLSKNKSINRILYPKHLGSLAKRKGQEFLISDLELFDPDSLIDNGVVDGSPGRIPRQLKESSNLAILSSIHYDPLFGLTSSASELVSLTKELKSEAFKRSFDDLPCISKSNASWYSTRLLQTCPNLSAIEIVEKNGAPLNFFAGEPEATHAKAVEYWNKSLSVSVPSRCERIVFGAGGHEEDLSLSNALARSFFNIARGAALMDSETKACMLAECSQGLGSEALLKYVTGSFVPRKTLEDTPYFDGLEVLLSLIRVQGDLEVSLVTTLPSYYGSKFGFKTLSAARDAPSSILSQGSRAKILVVPDSSRTHFTGSG